MKFIKVFLSILLLFILIVVAAGVALVVFIDPNKLKPVIVGEIQKRSGYQLTLDGKLSWSFYPKLGVKVAHMAFRNPGEAKAFVDLNDVTIATELMQLLQGNQKLNGEIYIANLKLMNMKAENAHINLNWQNNILTLDPISADLYSGSVTGVMRARELSATPKWDWDVTLKQIQVKPLLLDLNGAESKLNLTGLADVKMNAYTQGKSKVNMLANLNGSLAFSLKNGTVEGIDINYLLQTADALLNKGHTQSPTNINQTAFESLSGSSTIINGIVESDNILLTASTFAVKAKGTINLIYQAINLQLQIQSQQVLKTQWDIPVLITGSIYRPDIKLDTIEIEKEVAAKEIDKVKAKVRDEIKTRVPGKAGDFLQNLLK